MASIEERLPKRRPIVLLAEDEESDYVIFREALKCVPIQVDLHQVNDGEKALAFLRKQGEYGAAPTPDLVLLDLGLPKTKGCEVLHELEGDKALKHIPVVVLTSLDTPEEVYDSYRHCCNAFIVKPADYSRFCEMLRITFEFWFACARLPTALS